MTQISVSQTVDVCAAPAAVFALATGARLTEFVKANGPLPGVAGIEGAADWSAPGETRRLTLTDGSSFCEELTAIAHNQSFSYRATGFTGPFGALVGEGRGVWSFSATPTGATVTWNYAFTPKGALAAPIVAVIAKLFWPGYMRAALERLRTEVERDHARP